MREALRFGLRTYDLIAVLKNSVHRLAAGIAVAAASVGYLVASSVVVADGSGIVDCIETKPHRLLLCQ